MIASRSWQCFAPLGARVGVGKRGLERNRGSWRADHSSDRGRTKDPSVDLSGASNQAERALRNRYRFHMVYADICGDSWTGKWSSRSPRRACERGARERPERDAMSGCFAVAIHVHRGRLRSCASGARLNCVRSRRIRQGKAGLRHEGGPELVVCRRGQRGRSPCSIVNQAHLARLACPGRATRRSRHAVQQACGAFRHAGTSPRTRVGKYSSSSPQLRLLWCSVRAWRAAPRSAATALRSGGRSSLPRSFARRWR